MHQQLTDFENIVGKGEIARDEQFLLFPQCFRLNRITVSPFVHIFDIISLFAVELEEPKVGISGKGLRPTRVKSVNWTDITLSQRTDFKLFQIETVCRRQF